MLNEIIQDFNRRMEIRILEISAEFAQQLDFSGLETAIGEECARFSAERCAELVEVLQQAILEALLLEEIFLEWLKIYAGRRGMRFKERRIITVTLSNGHRIKVHSPYTSTSSAQAL